MKCVEIEPGIIELPDPTIVMLRIVFLYRGLLTTTVIYKKADHFWSKNRKVLTFWSFLFCEGVKKI